jgi:hypothetical protein
LVTGLGNTAPPLAIASGFINAISWLVYGTGYISSGGTYVDPVIESEIVLFTDIL